MRFSLLQLSESRVTRLADISSDMGQIFFASVFLGPLFSEKVNWLVVVSGLAFSAVAWLSSLLLTKE